MSAVAFDLPIVPTRPRLRAPGTALFLFIVVGPYVTLGLIESDTSPLYLAVVVARAFLFVPAARRGLFVTLWLSMALIVVNAMGEPDTRIVKFAATMVMAEALFHVGRSLSSARSVRMLGVVSVTWLIGGLVTLIQPEALSALFYRLGTSEGRGATGFSPEPSFYGLASAFLFGMAMQFGPTMSRDHLKGRRLSALMFAFATALSASLHALVILALLMLRRWPRLALVALPAAAATFWTVGSGSEIRLLALLFNALESGGDSLLADESIAYRLANFSAVANAFAGISTDIDEALASGLTILFVAQGAQGALWAVLFFVAGSWRAALWRMTCDPVQLPVVIAMLFIGPLSCPFFWLYLGLGSQEAVARERTRR